MMWSLLPRIRFHRTFMLVILIITVVILVNLTTIVIWQPLTNISLTEIHKCPACFGTSLCKHVNSGAIYLTGSSRFRVLNYLNNEKNVYFGMYRNEKVVLKKLAHYDELIAVDRKICAQAQMARHCNVSEAVTVLNMTKTLSFGRLINHEPGLMSCPSDRVLDLILDTYTERLIGQPLSQREKMTLITTLLVNAEPIIVQMFPPSKGWPFPRYYGACGRLIVMENIGVTLTDFYNASWWQRVNYAHQVLEIAELFTTNDLGFGLYWTDIGLENLAVTPSGQVKVIDAEHIIVVDRRLIKKEKGGDSLKPVVTEHIRCDDDDGISQCLHFLSKDLCSHVTSDINYYTACRLMLSRDGSTGLLHDVPHEVDSRHSLSALIAECTKPKSSRSRFIVKDKLLKVLALLATRNKTSQ